MRAFGTLLLVTAVFASAIALVYTRHESRKLFVELQSLRQVRDRLDVDWGRLQLEQSTWATHGRIERLARERLDMTTPSAGAVIVVEP
jgi:cell division protein FtsL